MLAIALAALLNLQTAPPPSVATPKPTAKPTQTSAPKPAQPAQPSAPKPTGTTGNTHASASTEQWPHVYAVADGEVAVYRPQVEDWHERKTISAYAAAAYLAKGAQKSVPGVIRFEADTEISLQERLVHLNRLRVTESNFPTLQKEQIHPIVDTIVMNFLKEHPVMALDRVLAAIDTSQLSIKNVDDIKGDPPTIVFSMTPAVLLNLDGEAIWGIIPENDLQFAVNTNWDLFQHTTSKTFFLLNGGSWLQAAELKGPWKPAGTLPASFSKLPATDDFKEARAALPGKPLTAAQTPTVYVSTTPAEMILLRGAPAYTRVPGTSLLWVNNTESDVFRIGQKGAIYYLVAGRWFSAPDFAGPWTFATLSLPEDFKKIPVEFERSRVLASVPGTRQAAEAVLLASVPQTARVNRKELNAPVIDYNGVPEFRAIEKTTVERAVNTDKDVIKVNDRYYLCYQGVWFVSPNAQGPWEVATTIPQEIYTIPASSPSHHVTYVVVSDDDPDDEWTTFAYTAGYTGTMVAWGCAVWGSGWYYPPYVWYGGYPIYYPHFGTYGYSAWYNPWTGGYGRSAVAYGPYGGMGATARYNPRTGTYSRGAAAWGPYGARGAAQAYNPRTGTYAQTRQGGNVYGNWGSSYVQRGDNWAQTAHVTNRVTGNTTRMMRTSEGNVYAGRDGNVYRREDGSWQKYDNGSWNSANRPEAQTRGQLDRDRAARTEGAQRTRDAGNYRGGTGSAGTYRGGGVRTGGGAMRGGGMRGGRR
jgi:hypothetical protein